MRLIISCLLLSYGLTSCVQTNLSRNYIKERKFEGYIFPNEHSLSLVSIEDIKERYTPTKEDIIRVEETLQKELSNINKSLINL